MTRRERSPKAVPGCAYTGCDRPRAEGTGVCRDHAEQDRRGEKRSALRPKRHRRGNRKHAPKQQGEVTRIRLVNADLNVEIDTADLPLLRGCKTWEAEHDSWTTYAVCCRGAAEVLGKRLHELLMGEPPSDGLTVDHDDGNGLNNRRSNLVWATKSEQRRNQRRPRRAAPRSKYTGVTAKGDCFFAGITIEDNFYPLGRFDDEVAAAIEFDRVAESVFGRSWVGLNYRHFPEIRQFRDAAW